MAPWRMVSLQIFAMCFYSYNGSEFLYAFALAPEESKLIPVRVSAEHDDDISSKSIIRSRISDVSNLILR